MATTPHQEKKPLKTVFVIMPFTQTPSRTKDQLDHFYEEWLKKPVERGRFASRYVVRRSDETFNITEQIIKDLYAADIVLADLSGTPPNPNVMYELGVRLAFSDSPVILIREKHPDNRPVFDVAGFYAETYDPLSPANVPEYIRLKIRRFESGQERYRSPVLAVLGQEFPLLMQVSRRRAAELLDVLDDSVLGTLRLFCGAAVDFIHGASSIRMMARTPDETVQELAERSAALKKLPWESFRFTPGSQPAIDYYIASPYLRDVLPAHIAKRFTSTVIEFHAHFLAGDVLWRHISFQAVYLFASQCAVLSLLCRILMRLLIETDPKKIEETLKHFEEAYGRVYWVWSRQQAKEQDQQTSAARAGRRVAVARPRRRSRR